MNDLLFLSWKIELMKYFITLIHYGYDVTPSAPTLHQLLRTISLLGRWSTSGSDRAIAHFFTATRITIEGVGEKKKKKNKRTICLGLTQVQKGSYVTLCICRLTQATRNASLSWPVFLTAPGPSLMPTRLSAVGVDCPVRRPSLTAFFESLCPTPFSRSLTHFRSPEISSQNPLSGFAPKQTKESSAWRTTYIVLHGIYNFLWKLQQLKASKIYK